MFGSRGLRIVRIFGIDIEIHPSWLVIFLLLFVSLTVSGSLRRPGAQLGLPDVIVSLLTTLAFFGSVLLHELAHSLVGRAVGVQVDRITLFIFGGVAQMTSEVGDPKSELLMAAAGPATSVALSFAFGIAYVAALVAGAAVYLVAPLAMLAWVNMVLALFNLVPGFPLDGGRLLRAFLWLVLDDYYKATRVAVMGGRIVAGLLMAWGVFQLVTQGSGGSPVDGLWMILIGFFLYNAATGSFQQLQIGRALSGVRVAEIMTAPLITVPAETSLAELVDGYFMRLRHGRFPVIDDGVLTGTVTLHDVRETPRDAWDRLSAREVASPVTQADFIDSREPALTALMRMAASGGGQLLVLENGAVVGIVTKTDIMEAIRIRSELARS